MRLALEVDDETIDGIIMASLKRTRAAVNDPKFESLYPDRAEITAACDRLIEYHSKPSVIEEQ